MSFLRARAGLAGGFTAFFVSVLMPAPLAASCGTAMCPFETPGVDGREAGTFTVDLSYLYVDQSQARVGTHRASPGDIPGHHDELSTRSRITSLRVGAALTRRFAIDLTLPFVQRDHAHVHHHHADQGEEGEEHEEHEEEPEEQPLRASFDGLGDVEVLSRFSLLAPEDASSLRLALLAGGSLPTGKDDARGTEVTPEGPSHPLAEVGIQPGAGTYSLIAGLAGVRSFDATTLRGESATLPVSFAASYRIYGKSRDDYRLGNSLWIGAGVVYPALEHVGISFQLDARHAARDDRGKTSEEVEKSGGTWIYASPGIQAGIGGGLLAYARLQVPVYQDVSSIQLVSPYNVGLGIVWRFDRKP